MKSYIKLDPKETEITCEKIKKAMRNQDLKVDTIKNIVKIYYAKPRHSRQLLAADSGFNNAYETPFTVFKSAVVDDEIRIESVDNICLFHGQNYSTDRLKRLLMQIILYEAIAKKVKTNSKNSLILVDGTITLSVFNPTSKDSKEYRKHFKDFVEELYSPLLADCIKQDVFLLGFLKRTGSTFLAHQMGVSGLYDIYIMNNLLKIHGSYIPPVPVLGSFFPSRLASQNYITFYLNLKGWNYRFELIEQQKDGYLECIENLLHWATNAHYGMNPIFSKADENARVTKRDANTWFNHILADLPEENQSKLRLEARKKTHFGYGSRSLIRGLTK